MTDSAKPRFAPPPVDLPAELEWVLVRALAPVESPVQRTIEAVQVAELADRLLVTPLIVRRTPADLLDADLGARLAARLRRDRLNDAAVQMQYRATSTLLAGTAHELGVPIVFLKGLALQLAGVVAAGDRPVSDVDVLLPEESAAEFQRRLLGLGFRHGAEVSMAHPHHLPPLWSNRWLGVEVHTAVPGVAVRSDTRFATAADLIENDLTVPSPETGEAALLPRPALTAVHLAVHALVHHPNSERFFFRLLADLAALLKTEDRSAILEMGRHIAPLVPRAELAGLVDLAAALAAGESPARVMDRSGPGSLALRHFSALAVDSGYRRRCRRPGLVLRSNALDLGGRSRLPQLWWPRKHVLGADGNPLTRRAWMVWNLARPFRFVSRTVSALLGR